MLNFGDICDSPVLKYQGKMEIAYIFAQSVAKFWKSDSNENTDYYQTILGMRPSSVYKQVQCMCHHIFIPAYDNYGLISIDHSELAHYV